MTTMALGNWLDDAACADFTVRLWESRSRTDRARAVEICRGCRVRTECLADALEAEEGQAKGHTIRGGLSPAERRTAAAMRDQVSGTTPRVPEGAG